MLRTVNTPIQTPNVKLNYHSIYSSLISRAQSRSLDCYTETHHIIPRCMGGDDSKSNLVELTPEEHFIAHQLLVKMHPTESKLIYAASWMRSRVANNKQYGWIKRRFVEAERAAKTGKPRSQESIDKQKATIAAKVDAGLWHKTKLGTTLTEEHKQAIREANTGKDIPIKSRSSLEGYILRYGEVEGPTRYTQDSRKKASSTLEAYITRHGEEEGTRRWNERMAKQSARMKNQPKRSWSDKDKERMKQQALARPKVVCPHCAKEGPHGIMQRWHFDKCKLKP